MEKLVYNNVVVVGGDHPNTLWVIRSLGKRGYKSTVIVLSDKHLTFVGKSKYVKDTYVVQSVTELLNKLHDLRFPKRTVLLATSDVTAKAIDSELSALSHKYICPNCANAQGRISYWMDKELMLQKAEECGFVVPQTTALALTDNIPTDIEFPCIVKPQKSSDGSKDDFRICNSATDLAVALEGLKTNVKSVVIQKYLKPDYEASILCLRSRKYSLNIAPGLLHKVRTCSSTNNMGMHTFCYVDDNVSQLLDINVINKFLDQIDYEGLYSIEFCVVDAVPYFLEINLRVDGCQYVFTTAGANMPGLWADLNYGYPSEKCQIRKGRTYGMTEISYIKYMNWKNPIEVILDLVKTDCFSIFSLTDIKPFLYKFLNVFLK